MDLIPHNPYHVRIADKKVSVRTDRRHKVYMQSCQLDDEDYPQCRASARTQRSNLKISEARVRELHDTVDHIVARYQPCTRSTLDKQYTRIDNIDFKYTRREQAPQSLIEDLSHLLHASFRNKTYDELDQWSLIDFEHEWGGLECTEIGRNMMAQIRKRTFDSSEDMEYFCATIADYMYMSEIILWGCDVSRPGTATCACMLDLSRRRRHTMSGTDTTLEATIINVCAFPHREGTGSKLMRCVKKFCAEHGVSEAVCLVLPDKDDTQELIRFYQMHGFEIEPSPTSTNPDVNSKIRMVCEVPLGRALHS